MRTSQIALSHAVRVHADQLRAFWVLLLVQGAMVTAAVGNILLMVEQAAH